MIKFYTRHILRLIKLKNYKLIILFTIIFYLTFLNINTNKNLKTTKQYYTVGKFIRANKPTTNYCKYNYGIPYQLNYIGYTALPNQLKNSPIRILYNVINNNSTSQFDLPKLTLCTHASISYLKFISELAKYWHGPISFTLVLTSLYDAQYAFNYLNILCYCLPDMYKVTIHVLFTKYSLLDELDTFFKQNRYKNENFDNYRPPNDNYLNNASKFNLEINQTTQLLDDTNDIDSILNDSFDINQNKTIKNEKRQTNSNNKRKTINNRFKKYNNNNGIKFQNNNSNNTIFKRIYKKPEACSLPKPPKKSRPSKFVYPINVARNVARFGANTKQILVSDVELIPSENLAENFLIMFDELLKNFMLPFKHVFVVPVFEIDKFVESIPRNKSQLIDLFKIERAFYFHRWTCLHCQKFPGMLNWITSPIQDNYIKPFLIVKREYPYHRWEPIYIGTNDEPLYNENLSWEGKQDKMAQMLEMCLEKYRFIILDGGFFVHTPGIKKKSKSESWRRPFESNNTKQYAAILKQLTKKYQPFNKLCVLKQTKQ